jgi:hypothetical protein
MARGSSSTVADDSSFCRPQSLLKADLRWSPGPLTRSRAGVHTALCKRLWNERCLSRLGGGLVRAPADAMVGVPGRRRPPS